MRKARNSLRRRQLTIEQLEDRRMPSYLAVQPGQWALPGFGDFTLGPGIPVSILVQGALTPASYLYVANNTAGGRSLMEDDLVPIRADPRITDAELGLLRDPAAPWVRMGMTFTRSDPQVLADNKLVVKNYTTWLGPSSGITLLAGARLDLQYVRPQPASPPAANNPGQIYWIQFVTVTVNNAAAATFIDDSSTPDARALLPWYPGSASNDGFLDVPNAKVPSATVHWTADLFVMTIAGNAATIWQGVTWGYQLTEISNQSTTLQLTTSLTPSRVGQQVTLTATVKPNSIQTVDYPTGIIYFYDSLSPGTGLLAGAEMSPVGQAQPTWSQASFAIAVLPAGAHVISAFYRGDNTRASCN